MLETNPNKITNLSDQKEEKDLLAREEVKTMEKDTSHLREIEARRERERLAEIKTAEELAKEREREKPIITRDWPCSNPEKQDW